MNSISIDVVRLERLLWNAFNDLKTLAITHHFIVKKLCSANGVSITEKDLLDAWADTTIGAYLRTFSIIETVLTDEAKDALADAIVDAIGDKKAKDGYDNERFAFTDWLVTIATKYDLELDEYDLEKNSFKVLAKTR